MQGQTRIGRLSAVAAFVLLAALGLRTQATIDLGYHLAYGETFLDTGRIVDHNEFLYTLPGPSAPDRPEPGPGSWYDDTGRYRFANANWLSQVVMALAWRAGGVWGAGLLTLVLVGLTGGLLFATVRRWGVASPGPCLALVLFTLIAYSRMNLRPELFGYAVLALQLHLLVPLLRDGGAEGALPRRTAVALIISQALFVNLHSYFLLGLGLAGAVLLEAVLARRRSALSLAWTGLLMAAACLLNPWTWRLAVLPFRTMVYMNAHRITRGPGEHPWSHIMEFRRALARDLGGQVHDWALYALLLLALVGAWGLARSRRWAALSILVAGVLVSLSMWRNQPPGALMVTPVAIAGCPAILRPAGRWRAILSLALVLVAVVSTVSVVTDRWYHREGYETRFGVGVSRVATPLGAAEWLDQNLPGARIWCDLSSSSNLHWYTRPHRQTPILSNTWAYPPAVMRESRRYRKVLESFENAVRRYGVEAVVLRTDWSQPLYMELVAHPDWELVHVEGLHTVLALARGPRSAIVRSAGASLRREDPQQLLERLAATDRFPDTALFSSGTALNLAGMFDHAIALFEHVVERQPSNAEAWQRLGSGYSARGKAGRAAGRPEAQADLEQAESCFRRAEGTFP